MYRVNIKELTKENENFRKVLYTGSNSQLVVMNIPVGGDIGEEIHPQTDQIIFIVKGVGEAIVSNESVHLSEHDALFIHAGTLHNIKNAGDKELKLFTVYAPPEHPVGTTQKTKSEADID